MARRPRLIIHGARGSTPAAGVDQLRYGGHTTCFSIQSDPSQPIVIDCGTGITFAHSLRPLRPSHFHVFMTHYHLDHLLGLQSFRPFFQEQHRFTFYGNPADGMSIRDSVAGVFAAPWFPVSLDEVPSRIEYVELDGSTLEVGPIAIDSMQLRHPQGATGYRFTHGARSVVVATDHEAGSPVVDARLVEFARGADALIHDAQYTPEEYDTLHRGWGHSTWRDAVSMARAANVPHVILTSHDPFRTDMEIDDIVAEARREYLSVEAAHEGLIVEL
jgi:phosphoribosyl 1,2-cyclic phosphodiesterase